MESSHPLVSPSGLIRSLALPPYPSFALEQALNRIERPGPLCVLHDVILDSHPARLRRAAGPRDTAFECRGGRAWRMALLPRAYTLLTLRSPDDRDTAAATITGLILGALAPGDDLLGPTPSSEMVRQRLTALSAVWQHDWVDLGLTHADEAWIWQVAMECVAPRMHVPEPVWGPTAVIRLAAYAVDQPGAVRYGEGVVHLPRWADPDLPLGLARLHLRRAVSRAEAPLVTRLADRGIPFCVVA